MKGVVRKSLIYKSGVEYADHALSLYEGCGHSCRYCFCPLMKKIDRSRWGYARPVANAIELLVKELPKKKRKIKDILISFSGDPYQPMERRIGLTRRVLTILVEQRVPFNILTKSTLVRRDFDLIARSKGRFGLGMSLTTLDDNAKRYWEPYAPSTWDRMGVLRDAHSAGIRTWASVEPILDGTFKEIVYRTCEFVDFYVFGKLNYFRPLKPIEWTKVREEIEEICKSLGLRYLIKKELRDKR